MESIQHWLKAHGTAFQLDVLMISLAFTLWTLPIGFGLRVAWGVRMAILLPLILIMLIRLIFLRHRITISGTRTSRYLMAAFVGLWCIAFLRTAFREIDIDTLYILAYLSFLIIFSIYLILSYSSYGRDDARRLTLRFAAMMTMGLYVVTNLLLFLLGVRQPDRIYLASYPSQVLSLLGVEWDRTLFPLADSISSFGIIAGAVLVMFVPSLKSGISAVYRITAFVVVLACLPVLLMTDSRGAMLFSLAILVLAFLPKALLKYTRWIPILVSMSPIFIMLTSPSFFENLGWLNRPSGRMDLVQRNALATEYCDEQAVPAASSLSNRPFIWGVVLRELSQPELVHVLGFGFRGQVVSGLSKDLSCIFLSYVNRDLVSAHHIWLQVVLDVGYFGLALILGLVIWMVARLTRLSERTGDIAYTGILYCTLYIVLAGTLEATLSPDYTGTFVLFLIVALLTSISFSDQPLR